MVGLRQRSAPRGRPGSGGARRFGAGLLLVLALMLACAAGAAASPGQVDYAFGYFGTLDITNDLPGLNSEEEALAMAVGPANETIVVSSRAATCAGGAVCSDLFVTRYDADGTLDPAFGSRAGVADARRRRRAPPARSPRRRRRSPSARTAG